MEYKEFRDKVVMVVVNTEKNQELISNSPSRSIMDLTILYRWIIKKGDNFLSGMMVTNQIAKDIGMDEEQLFIAAMENTEKILPAKQMYMSDHFCVLTNTTCINGAATMLYKGLLQKVADKMKSNVFVIPSSIHEIIVIPDIGVTVDEVEEMIEDANKNVVESYEVLSSNPYYYNRKSQSIDLARKVLCN